MPRNLNVLLLSIFTAITMSGTVKAGSSEPVESSVWHLAQDVSGVKTYVRDVESSEYRAQRSETLIRTRLSNLVAMLRDPTMFSRWRESYVQNQLLRRNSPQDSVVYVGINMPWPAYDKDMVLQSRWSQDARSLVVTKTERAEPHYVKASKEYERLSRYEATWTLTPLPNGWVHVRFDSFTDPGGENPEWMLDYLSVEVPSKTLLNMRSFKHDYYKHVEYAFIKEMPADPFLDNAMGMAIKD